MRKEGHQSVLNPLQTVDKHLVSIELGSQSLISKLAGKRNKPKRQFIMPALRQAVPSNSKFVEPISDCHWTCRICNSNILAAVISAGAIKHFRAAHPAQVDLLQAELCKACF